MRSTTLEPASTLPQFHIDLHVDEDWEIKRQLYSAEAVRLDIGVASIFLSRAALAKLMEEGALALEDLELMAKYPDPLPEI